MTEWEAILECFIIVGVAVNVMTTYYGGTEKEAAINGLVAFCVAPMVLMLLIVAFSVDKGAQKG